MGKKKIFALILVLLLLSGCGGEYGELPGNTGASDGASSASAVSGQAASDSVGTSRYTYCSDWSLYYIRDSYSENERLVERNLEDGSEREIPMKGIHEICYVDNDWVYYAKRMTVEEDEDTKRIVGEVWRAPINKTSCQMDEGAEELVLKENDEVGMVLSRSHVGIDYRGILCDGRYIVFCGGEWTGPEGVQSLDTFLRVYDIQAGCYVHEKRFREDVFCYDISDVELCGGSVFLCSEGEDGDGELVRVKLDTGKKSVAAPFENFQLDEEMHSYVSTTSDEDIFWKNFNGKEEEIWQYCLAEQKSFCLIRDEECRELLESRGLLDCLVGGKKHMFWSQDCFVRAGRLYVQMEIEGEGSHGEICHNRIIVSKELGKPEAELVFEDGLNECLANPESRQKVFAKKYDGIYGRQPHEEKMFFRSRGFCVGMTEEECLMYLENEDEKKNMPASYNFQTGKLLFLDEKEDWISRNVYAVNNWVLSGDSGKFMEPYDICDSMPNNYDVLGE